MKRMSGSIVLGGFLGLLLLQLQCGAAQTTYVVGDTVGWIVPQNDSVYKNWASSKTFRVGDTLRRHDVVRVSKTSYESCNTTNPIGNISYTGPTNITLSDAGDHYFICTFNGHCSGGQKLAVTVSAASGPSSSPSPMSPGVPPPPGSSAAAVYATSFLVVLSIVIGMAF